MKILRAVKRNNNKTILELAVALKKIIVLALEVSDRVSNFSSRKKESDVGFGHITFRGPSPLSKWWGWSCSCCCYCRENHNEVSFRLNNSFSFLEKEHGYYQSLIFFFVLFLLPPRHFESGEGRGNEVSI